jgi:hypothetical protein
VTQGGQVVWEPSLERWPLCPSLYLSLFLVAAGLIQFCFGLGFGFCTVERLCSLGAARSFDNKALELDSSPRDIDSVHMLIRVWGGQCFEIPKRKLLALL